MAAAATLLITFARPLAIDLIKKIPGAAGSWIFQKAINQISGGSDTEKLQKELEEMSKLVTEIHSTIKQLEDQLPADLLKIRQDHLNTNNSVITSKFESIQYILEEVFNGWPGKDEKGRKELVESAKSRMTDILKLAINVVPEALENISGVLLEDDPNAFVRRAADQLWKHTPDAFTYVKQMKTLMVPYWITQAKGLALLELARFTEKSNLDSAGHVKKFTARFKEEENLFKKHVGTQIFPLLASLQRDSTVKIPVSFESGDGGSFIRGFEDGDPKNAYLFEGRQMWYLTAVNTLGKLDEPGLSPYTFWLQDATTRGYLQFGPDRDEPIVAVDKGSGSWLIRTVPNTDHFYIRWQSSQHKNGFYLWTPRRSDKAILGRCLATDNDGCTFRIRPYKGDLFGKVVRANEHIAWDTYVKSGDGAWKLELFDRHQYTGDKAVYNQQIIISRTPATALGTVVFPKSEVHIKGKIEYFYLSHQAKLMVRYEGGKEDLVYSNGLEMDWWLRNDTMVLTNQGSIECKDKQGDRVWRIKGNSDTTA